MADERKTQVTYQGNGTQRVYSFSFDYLRKAFVKVRLIDNETRKELVQGTEYTVTDKQITLASPTNLKIEIVRQTTTQPLVAWKDASVLKAVDMSVQEVQLLHLAEETRDEVRDGGMALSEAAQAWDARMHRIINLLDPQDPTDAVTLHYITANKESFLNELQTKGQEQVQGITQTGNTYLNRLNALKQAGEASASNAAQASVKATAAQDKAKDWAISTGSPDGQTDTESSTGKTQSSRSWALIAKDLWSQCVSVLNEVNTYMQTVLSKAEEATIAAQQAFQAQVGAKQQATKATTQATQAAQSAQAAAKSAQQAATWNPDNYYTKNKSDDRYYREGVPLPVTYSNEVNFAGTENTIQFGFRDHNINTYRFGNGTQGGLADIVAKAFDGNLCSGSFDGTQQMNDWLRQHYKDEQVYACRAYRAYEIVINGNKQWGTVLISAYPAHDGRVLTMQLFFANSNGLFYRYLNTPDEIDNTNNWYQIVGTNNENKLKIGNNYIWFA